MGQGYEMGGVVHHLLNLLRQDERFFSTDGKFLNNAVYEAAMKFDEKLLSILLNDELTRKKFFIDANKDFI